MFCLLIGFAFTSLQGQVYLTKDEALRLYFPDEKNVSRKTHFLSEDQVQQVQNLARAKVDSKILTYYEYIQNGKRQNIAFFETQIVRTHPATCMIVLNSDGSVKGVEMLAFFEPEDYMPPKNWFAQFNLKTRSDDIHTKRGIPNVAGATLSAQAITESVRKYMAVYELIFSKEK
jgi:hypothetical protein